MLAVRACTAYLGSSSAVPFRFDGPPFRWRALPIIDSDRFFGFVPVRARRFVRFANRPVRVFDALGGEAYGMYPGAAVPS